MQKRKLGYSDLYLTTIGFGAWAIGGGNWDWGWGSQEDVDSLATIHQVLEAGINWIDTAANEIECSWLPSVAWSGTIRTMARFSID
jgi:aryl-alcohol dehydrogenase-like predicted oxidoreductase